MRLVQHASLNVGYLGKRDGALWCFPDDEMASDDEMTLDGFEVHDAELKLLDNLVADRRVYLLQHAAPRPQQHAKQPPPGR